jgi:hypothetical protein
MAHTVDIFDPRTGRTLFRTRWTMLAELASRIRPSLDWAETGRGFSEIRPDAGVSYEGREGRVERVLDDMYPVCPVAAVVRWEDRSRSVVALDHLTLVR